MTPAPRVHITPHARNGGALVAIEATDDDDLRGGRLTITLQALRLLPAALEAALAKHDAREAA